MCLNRPCPKSDLELTLFQYYRENKNENLNEITERTKPIWRENKYDKKRHLGKVKICLADSMCVFIPKKNSLPFY